VGGEIRKISLLLGLELRPLGRPARSQSLYRLRYPGSLHHRLRNYNYPSIYGSTAPLLGLDLFFSFLIFYTVGRTPWTGDRPVAGPLSAHGPAQMQNKFTQTSMPQVGFEPTIAVFERAKTVHALDRGATVIGKKL
jgi:hypothetical protein